jgi:ribonuclease HI
MKEILLFTDGSVNTKSKIGFGAYLAVFDSELSLDDLRTMVKVRRFENTSSTKLELQTLLWALNEIKSFGKNVKVYTDSQNILTLSGRRSMFEQNDYKTNNSRNISNHELYKAFYILTDQMNCEFVKVHGHMASHQKENIDMLFTLVDRASRKALRVDKLS